MVSTTTDRISSSPIRKRRVRSSLQHLVVLPVLLHPDMTSSQTATVPLPEMQLIQGGVFEIGSLADFRSQPVLSATVETFFIGKYEITFDEYDAFTSATGKPARNDVGWGRGRRPVVDVSWEDANEYAEWLSDVTGKRYRLPTEVEWEYAARAGSLLGPYSWGESIGNNRANCDDCSVEVATSMTLPVGSFEPNLFGLFDMHGNVWEMTQSCYSHSYFHAITYRSPFEWPPCDLLIVRGGSWNTSASQLRFWYRDHYPRDTVSSDVGIRLVMEADLED